MERPSPRRVSSRTLEVSVPVDIIEYEGKRLIRSEDQLGPCFTLTAHEGVLLEVTEGPNDGQAFFYYGYSNVIAPPETKILEIINRFLRGLMMVKVYLLMDDEVANELTTLEAMGLSVVESTRGAAPYLLISVAPQTSIDGLMRAIAAEYYRRGSAYQLVFEHSRVHRVYTASLQPKPSS